MPNVAKKLCTPIIAPRTSPGSRLVNNESIERVYRLDKVLIEQRVKITKGPLGERRKLKAMAATARMP